MTAQTFNRPTIQDCAHDAVLLLGMTEAIGHLQNDGHTNALVAVIESLITDARNLANKLDVLEVMK